MVPLQAFPLAGEPLRAKSCMHPCEGHGMAFSQNVRSGARGRVGYADLSTGAVGEIVPVHARSLGRPVDASASFIYWLAEDGTT